MKLKVEIDLDAVSLRRWTKYQTMHSFLEPTTNQLMSALVRAGLERWYEHLRKTVERRGIQKGRHDLKSKEVV